MKTGRIESTDEAWESRALGASEDHAAVAGEEYEIALNAALGLKPTPKDPAAKMDRSCNYPSEGKR